MTADMVFRRGKDQLIISLFLADGFCVSSNYHYKIIAIVFQCFCKFCQAFSTV